MNKQVELKSKDQLNTIIVNKNGKPYKTAIEIYWYLRSWYTPIKAKKSDGSTVNISKIYTDGIHICKKELQEKFSCGPEAIRRAIVFLEELGLVSRGFEKKGKSVNHLVLYVWKNTPNFYNKFGVTKEEVGDLQSATVHWLRHTGISDDVKRRPREHVRDDAGHNSSQTTDRYIDVDLRERHQSAKNKPIKNE